MEAALAVGLQGMSVSDHNSAEAVDAVRAAAAGTGLYVFPAMEITTRGGHVLGIFDNSTPSSVLWDTLKAVGLPREASGDPTPMAKVGTEEVYFEIQSRGGIAIAAHIDRWPSGLTETGLPTPEKVHLHESPLLSAIEITAPLDKPLWNEGQMRRYPLCRACTQGSDAHAPCEIGRRPVFARMEEVSLDGLRQALLEYRLHIRFPHEMNGDLAAFTAEALRTQGK